MYMSKKILWTRIFYDAIYPINETHLSTLTFKPKILFHLFKSYDDNSLDKIYQFIFPTALECEDTELVIKLITKLPYDDIEYHIEIKLIPTTFNEYEKLDYKIFHSVKLIYLSFMIFINDIFKLPHIKSYFIHKLINLFNNYEYNDKRNIGFVILMLIPIILYVIIILEQVMTCMK